MYSTTSTLVRARPISSASASKISPFQTQRTAFPSTKGVPSSW